MTLLSGEPFLWCGKTESATDDEQDEARSKAEKEQDDNHKGDESTDFAAKKAAELVCHNQEEVNNELGAVCTFQVDPTNPASVDR